MQNTGKYYSKILLFGEYTVMNGSSVLSIPYKNFSAHLVTALQGTGITGETVESNRLLSEYCDFLCDGEAGKYIETARFRQDIDSGLFMESNIPVGYGLGSSGALVASVFNAYGKAEFKNKGKVDLLGIFASLETYFHGKSSGMDPLSCFTGEPLYIRNPAKIETTRVPGTGDPHDLSIFLLDTGMTSATGPLVNLYLEKLEEQEFKNRVEKVLVPLTDSCIENIIDYKSEGFFQDVRSLSELQLLLLPEMIPGHLVNAWKFGLESGDFCLKLCGSGGGGYLLVFAKDPGKILECSHFEGRNILRVSLS